MLALTLMVCFAVGAWLCGKKGWGIGAIILGALFGLFLAGTSWGGKVAGGLADFGNVVLPFSTGDASVYVLMFLFLLFAWLSGRRRSEYGLSGWGAAFGLIFAGTELGGVTVTQIVEFVGGFGSVI